jgi:hypothetical protein
MDIWERLEAMISSFASMCCWDWWDCAGLVMEMEETEGELNGRRIERNLAENREEQRMEKRMEGMFERGII